jgi:hypothetical protein
MFYAFRDSLVDGVSPDAEVDLKSFPYAMFLLLVVYGLALGSFFRRFVAHPLATWGLGTLYAREGPGSEVSGVEKKRRTARRRKFVSSALELLIYSAFFLAGARLLSQQDWLWPSRLWWEDTPSKSFGVDLAFFYVAYASRYVCQFCFVFLDPHKKDFVEMQTHHVVTSALVCISYAYGMVRIGILIMVVFDFADPFLHAAKLVTYCKEAAGTAPSAKLFSAAADVFFGLFAVVFFVTRILLFSYLTYSVTYESFLYMSPQQDFVHGVMHLSRSVHVCVALVWALYCLQWFWFNLLTKVIAKTLRGEELKDNRSDDEDEGEQDADDDAQGRGRRAAVVMHVDKLD